MKNKMQSYGARWVPWKNKKWFAEHEMPTVCCFVLRHFASFFQYTSSFTFLKFFLNAKKTLKNRTTLNAPSICDDIKVQMRINPRESKLNDDVQVQYSKRKTILDYAKQF
jgi:hypothetical protein